MEREGSFRGRETGQDAGMGGLCIVKCVLELAAGRLGSSAKTQQDSFQHRAIHGCRYKLGNEQYSPGHRI